jgi:hypothetical protein
MPSVSPNVIILLYHLMQNYCYSWYTIVKEPTLHLDTFFFNFTSFCRITN